MTIENAEMGWWEFLRDKFQGPGAFILFDNESGLPELFANPHCATCVYWFPVHRYGLDKITDPHEIQYMAQGLQGKIHMTVSSGGDHEGYNDYDFFGRCKRYPPPHRDTYSIISFRSLISLVSRKIPLKVADYSFPVTNYENMCGEWKKGDWVEEFIDKNKRSK